MNHVFDCIYIYGVYICVIVYLYSPLCFHIIAVIYVVRTHCPTGNNIQYIVDLAHLTLHSVCIEFTVNYDTLQFPEVKHDSLD